MTQKNYQSASRHDAEILPDCVNMKKKLASGQLVTYSEQEQEKEQELTAKVRYYCIRTFNPVPEKKFHGIV